MGDGGGGGMQGEFVWPPRVADAGPETEPGSGAEPGAAIVDRGGSGDGRVDAIGAGGADRVEVGGGLGWGRSGGRGLRGWALIERAVLGGAMASLPAGWAPEPAGSACGRCGGTVGIGEADGRGCGSCRGKSLAWCRAVRLGSYDGALRAGVIGCKYRADRAAGIRLGRLLGERVRGVVDGILEEIAGEGGAGGDGERVLVVPVPTTLRRRQRNGGVDHAMVIARGVAGAMGVSPTRILRRRHGPSQTAVSAAARARQVEGVFSPRIWRVPGRVSVVVLVDDVRTTGATATACVRAMRGVLGGGWRPGRGRDGKGGGPVFVLATAAVSDGRRGRAEEAAIESAFLSPEGAW